MYHIFFSSSPEDPPLHLSIPSSGFGVWEASPARLCLTQAAYGRPVPDALARACLTPDGAWMTETANGTDIVVPVSSKNNNVRGRGDDRVSLVIVNWGARARRGPDGGCAHTTRALPSNRATRPPP